MGRTRRIALSAAATAWAAATLAACGSGTKTVTVSGAPPASQTASTASTSTQTTSTAQTAPTTSTQTQPQTSTTRSAPEPAFAQHETHAEGVGAATATVTAHGYTPNDASQYHSDQTLRVLVGTRTGSSDGYDQQAFFFVDGKYIGTDTKDPSASIKVVSQSDTEVTLGYATYAKGAPLSSPSGEAKVTYALNDGKLVPVDRIPSTGERN
jgi:LppP/LprE lipoprotein